MYWRLSESFKARLWNERRSVKELEASLIETQKRAVLVKQARAGMPTNTGAFANRVAAMRARMDELQERLNALDRQAEPLSAGSRDRRAGPPETAHRDLPGSGALRAGGDLRQDREPEREAGRRQAAAERPVEGAPMKGIVVRARHRHPRVHAAFAPAGHADSKKKPQTIKDLDSQQIDISPDPPQERRQRQDHGELQALSRPERRRCGAARGGDAPTGRSEPGELRVRAHRARARDQRGPAGDGGHPSLYGPAQDLSQVRAQRLGAVSAGARLRAQRAARQGARDARQLVANYPKSHYIDEAQFRRGEILFSNKSLPRGAERLRSGHQVRLRFGLLQSEPLQAWLVAVQAGRERAQPRFLRRRARFGAGVEEATRRR